MQYTGNNFESIILSAANRAELVYKARPLFLGGYSGANGGVGSPPGGYIGYLPQSKSAFDTTEAEVWTMPSSGISLVTNLNRIRYRIAALETGGGGGVGGIYTLRALSENITIPDTGCTILAGYIDLNGYDITLEGDSVLEVI